LPPVGIAGEEMEQFVMLGKPVAEKIRIRLKAKVAAAAARRQNVKLATLRVEGDSASEVYQNRLAKVAESIGVEVQTMVMPKGSGQGSVECAMEALSANGTINAILPLQPFPPGLDAKKILEKLSPEKDADCLTTVGAGKFYLGRSPWGSATPRACMEILRYYGIRLEGKRVVVIGRSNVVGKPVAHLLQQANATVTLCHSHTNGLPEICREADVIVAAIGKPGFVTADMVREGVVLVDVGINVTENGLRGDINATACAKASAYTPVPGGVGVVSNWMILEYLTRSLPEVNEEVRTEKQG